MIKRLADWTEKVSVASLAVGLFQNNELGFWVAASSFAVSLWLTHLMEKK